jgi:hypothetical protein
LRLNQLVPARVASSQNFATKPVWLAKGYGSFQSAWRTLQDIETVAMIRKGRVRWLVKGEVVGQAHLIAELFGIAA